jgi:hypothetical protein
LSGTCEGERRPLRATGLAVAALAAAGLLAGLAEPSAAAATSGRGATGPAAAVTGGAAMSTRAVRSAADVSDGQRSVAVSAGAIGCVRGRRAPAGSVGCRADRGTPHFPATSRRTEQVRQLVECGGRIYAVGTFREVIGYSARRHAMVTFHRRNAFSFSAARPFAVSGWNPNVNGEVNSVALDSRCRTAYLGGSFSRVHGKTAHNIVRVNASTSTVWTGFAHNANDVVDTLLLHGGALLTGGFFTAINGSGRRYYAGLNPVTGRDDGYLRLAVHGHYQYPGVARNRTKVYNQQLSHGGTRLLAEGDFTSVGGKHRQQIFMLTLGASRAKVTSWTSSDFNGNCSGKESFYVRGAAWSTDDKTVYVATTGYHPAGGSPRGKRTGLCDAAAAFPAKLRPVGHLWRNYTGCDSLYSAVAGPGVAYFGGHERWADNRHGCDHRGPGAIKAPGMVGLSASGAVTFDPTRSRGLGADDMLLTGAGLWVASDNFDGSQRCAHTKGLAGICFLPY